MSAAHRLAEASGRREAVAQIVSLRTLRAGGSGALHAQALAAALVALEVGRSGAWAVSCGCRALRRGTGPTFANQGVTR